MTSWRRGGPASTPGTRPVLPAYEAPEHALQDVLCSRKGCTSPADGWYEGTPYCAGCADDVIERDLALEANPWLQLPDLDDR